MSDVIAAAVSRPGRRRQRSVRVTVAVGLLVLATLLVLVALPTQSPLWLSVAAVASLLLGWAAARIIYSELRQSRREAAADRAAQARAYRDMFAARAAEHAEFTSALAERLLRRDREVADLAAAAASAERRAAEAEGRVQREARRLVEAQETVQRLSARVAELDPAHLMAWEERVSAAAAAGSAARTAEQHA
jgi:ABC-type nickel/cobalt efflux system permease component RcnA